MSSISSSALRKLTLLAAQNLANTAWSFSTRQLRDKPLLSAIAAASLPTINQFGGQRLSNTAWSFATIAFVHEPLLNSIASSALRKISEFDPQGVSNTAWAFAPLLFRSNEPLCDSIAAAALRRLTEFDPQNIANTAWAYALLVEFDRPLIAAISASAIAKIQDFSSQSLANTAWAFANLEVMNQPLLDAISAAARRMLCEFTGVGWRRLDLVSFALGLLGIAWAHAFLEVENVALQNALKGTLAKIGVQVDAMESQLAKCGSGKPELEPEAIRGIVAKKPHLELDLHGMIVIHKQPDWEVDGRGRAEKEHVLGEGPPALSAWLRAELPRSCYPLTRDVDLDFGFLHRLDVPSSGLILCGVTFSGLLALRWQLDTYLIERQYAVCGHDLAHSSLREVTANIDPQTIDSRRSFISEVHGKPATSWFTIPAHFHAPKCSILREERSSESCSVFIVRIRTGRRHQIRAHMLSAGHPTVVDAKYATLQVIFLRLLDYEKGYLNSGCPD